MDKGSDESRYLDKWLGYRWINVRENKARRINS